MVYGAWFRVLNNFMTNINKDVLVTPYHSQPFSVGSVSWECRFSCGVYGRCGDKRWNYGTEIEGFILHHVNRNYCSCDYKGMFFIRRRKMNKILKIRAKKLKGNMNTLYMCPKCNEIVNLDNYCSNCGAKLKGDSNE